MTYNQKHKAKIKQTNKLSYHFLLLFFQAQISCFYNLYHIIFMKSLFKIFDSRLQIMMDPSFYIDCKTSQFSLLKQLRSSSQKKKLIKILSSNTSDPLKIIRTLNICALLIVYTDQYYQIIEENFTYKISKDQWLNKRFIDAFYHFIKRCCASSEQYKRCITGIISKGNARQSLFYSIQMLKHLFKIVEKMPFLGRYYKSKNQQLVCSAIQIIAFHAQKIYSCFKEALNHILSEKNTYIRGPEDEKILKSVFGQQLITINEEMKKLFLDKYFYPLGKGIGVKLFRTQQQPIQVQKQIKKILNNHEETQRQKQLQTTYNNLFPKNGLVNWKFFEQSLVGGPLNNTIGGLQKTVYKDLDDLNIQQQDEYDQKVQQITVKKQGFSQKQTNSGTGQSKMEL